MEVIFILYFNSVTPNNDYTLSIVFDNYYEIRFPMIHLLKQFRFSPLRDLNVWKRVELFPTHLEWNMGTFQVNLNIEEIVRNF
ncbi:DUF2442 domain-containing protein [Sedimentibacter acidaminivorans]|uniref:DUF2442 domain-containing protein n=1 Tax=Sedimentibacter acidaminivorans TaxID=913099 RepID=UPI001AE675A3